MTWIHELCTCSTRFDAQRDPYRRMKMEANGSSSRNLARYIQLYASREARELLQDFERDFPHLNVIMEKKFHAKGALIEFSYRREPTLPHTVWFRFECSVMSEVKAMVSFMRSIQQSWKKGVTAAPTPPASSW